jgi:peptidoglycan hydrolase CwlO-like protein
MVKQYTTRVLIIISLFIFFSFFSFSVHAQTVTPTPTSAPDTSQQASDLQRKIADLENKISTLKGQEQTLSSQISVFDSQIRLTEYRIEATKEQILSLSEDIDTTQKKIAKLENSLADITKVLLNRVVAGYEVGSINPFQILLASNTIGDFFTRSNYLRVVQRHDKKLVYDTVQAKNDYSNQQQIFEDKKKQVLSLQTQLQSYTDDLNSQKQEKQDLLSETQGSEDNYQKLLAQAKAQLASLANFATSRVGAGGSIIAHQDLSDGWGKYYNQRDANWGNHLIGYSSYQVWEVGCLLTSYAMVSTHFGSTVTPLDVASNPDNFALGTAMFRLPGPAPSGHSVYYVQNPSLDDLRNDLSSGKIIIAGLSADGGPSPQHYSDHWVVLRSVDGSSFRINDPWYSDGMNSLLSTHYSGWTIIEARIYN